MEVALSDAKAQLTELARRAEAGEEIVLTRRGRPAVKLVPVNPPELSVADRWALLEQLQGAAKNHPGWRDVDAAHAADFLYDEHGLPA